MKKLILIYLVLLTVSVAMAQRFPPGALVSSKREVSGGPDTWYDIQASGGANSGVNAVTDEQLWANVTVGSAGTATKIRFSVTSFTSSTGVKFGFYDSGGTLLATASGTVSADGDNQELTLSPSVSVTATTYKILVVSGATGGFSYRLLTGTGTLNYLTTPGQYSSGPPSSIPSGSTIGWNICFGVYVD